MIFILNNFDGKVQQAEGYIYPIPFRKIHFFFYFSLYSLRFSDALTLSQASSPRPPADGGAAVFSGLTSPKAKLLTPIPHYFSS
jgi:hypothetical protein